MTYMKQEDAPTGLNNRINLKHEGLAEAEYEEENTK